MTAETVTPAEPRTITTMRADQLQPGDVVRLIGDADDDDCTVVAFDLRDGKRLVLCVTYECYNPAFETEVEETAFVKLWRYSRVEVLSDVSGRGHLVTPMMSAMTSESMEEPQGEPATASS